MDPPFNWMYMWPKTPLPDIYVHHYAWGVSLKIFVIRVTASEKIWLKVKMHVFRVCACVRVCFWMCLCSGTSLQLLVTASLCRKAPTGNDRWIWPSWPSLETVRDTHTTRRPYIQIQSARMTTSKKTKGYTVSCQHCNSCTCTHLLSLSHSHTHTRAHTHTHTHTHLYCLVCWQHKGKAVKYK